MSPKSQAHRPPFHVGGHVFITSPTHHKPDGLVRARVTKIGYQYATVMTHRTFRFDLDTLVEVDANIDTERLGRLFVNPDDYDGYANDGERLVANQSRLLDEYLARIPMLSLDQSERLLRVLRVKPEATDDTPTEPVEKNAAMLEQHKFQILDVFVSRVPKLTLDESRRLLTLFDEVRDQL